MRAHAALSAAENEWDGDAIALLEFGNSAAYLDDDAADLVAGHEWQAVLFYIAIVASPAVPVGSAYARGHYLDNDAIGRRFRCWQ
mmetsp:Transcript_33343/g.70093  ORF Transcript_33343/g.70093 Transcript_33343/m.70093 type:complete len:85 (+) Transcript_33343:1552-1806(+)